MDHIERFLRVANVFVQHFREKLNTFMGSLCLKFDEMLVVSFERYSKTDKITRPCGVTSLVIR